MQRGKDIEKNCLNCKHGNYYKQGRVVCFIYDDLVMETHNCGLWRGKNE
jgi:hypothetical protein